MPNVKEGVNVDQEVVGMRTYAGVLLHNIEVDFLQKLEQELEKPLILITREMYYKVLQTKYFKYQGTPSVPSFFSISKHSVINLNIVDPSLKKLPSSLQNLKCLRTLIIHADQLQELPNNLDELLHLKVFHVYSSQLEYLGIPPSSLTALKYLDLLQVNRVWLYLKGKLEINLQTVESILDNTIGAQRSENRITGIGLSNFNLHIIPEIICNFTDIRTL